MPSIYWASDSTVAHNSAETWPQVGLGQYLAPLLAPNWVLHNHAVNGRSTKSFLDEGRLAPIYDQLEAADLLFVQFGHNDEKSEDPRRYTEPQGDYRENLLRFCRAAHNRGARLVLISPLSRRDFDEDGRVRNLPHQPYRQVMAELAAEEGIAYVDLTAASARQLELVGPEASKAYYMHFPAGAYPQYPEGKQDDTHLREAGARIFAQILASELLQLGAEFRGLFRED